MAFIVNIIDRSKILIYSIIPFIRNSRRCIRRYARWVRNGLQLSLAIYWSICTATVWREIYWWRINASFLYIRFAVEYIRMKIIKIRLYSVWFFSNKSFFYNDSRVGIRSAFGGSSWFWDCFGLLFACALNTFVLRSSSTLICARRRVISPSMSNRLDVWLSNELN